MGNPYAEILRRPGALAFSTTGFVARLPMSMIGIGIILVVEAETGSYALAGAVSATHGVAFALIAPQFSRLVDRYGQRRITLPQLAVYGTGLVALIALAVAGAPAWTLFVAALVAGAEPTIGSLTRSRWSYLLGSGPALRTAFSWESVLDEVVYVVGPPAVTLAAVAVSPPAALLGVAVIGVGGGLLFLAQRRTEPPVRDGATIPPGSALGQRWLWVLMVVMLFLGGIFGCIEIVTVARAEELGSLPAAGLVLSVYAAGSLVAGLAYGWKRPPMPLRGQLVLGSVGMAVLTPLFYVGAGSVAALSGVALVCGLAISPTLIVSFALTEELAPAERLTESLSWMVTGIALGVALGAAASGWLIDEVGARPAFLGAAACGLVTAVVALLGYRALVPSAAVRPTAARRGVAT